MEEKNHCQDCVHYLPHYIKTHKKFKVANCGHCTLKRQRLQKYFSVPCENFQQRNDEQEKISRNGSLRDTLLNMLKQLNEMLTVLDSEK